MKKIGLFISLLTCSTLLAGCRFHVNFNDTNTTETTSYNLNNDAGRLLACNDKVGFYLNTETFNAERDLEEEAGASFVLNGHVTREENGNTAEDDVQCIIDMVDQSVKVEFSNHKFNGESQESSENEDAVDIMNDEKLLSLYPEIQENNWNIILGNTLQTNYINGTNTIYYDPYRGIAFKLGAEFDGGLIREIDTDENGIPHSEIILLVKGDENEENRTGINGFREVYTISVVSKTNLENFNANPDLANAIGENNEYYFDGYGIDTNIHFSDLQIFDVEEMTY